MKNEKPTTNQIITINWTALLWTTREHKSLKWLWMVQQKKIDFLLSKTWNHVNIYDILKLGLFACGGIITKKPEILLKWFLLITDK